MYDLMALLFSLDSNYKSNYITKQGKKLMFAHLVF